MTITWLANYSSITNCQIMSWFCLAVFVSEAKYKIARIGRKTLTDLSKISTQRETMRYI